VGVLSRLVCYVGVDCLQQEIFHVEVLFVSIVLSIDMIFVPLSLSTKTSLEVKTMLQVH
jgi:hypothetical protein